MKHLRDSPENAQPTGHEGSPHAHHQPQRHAEIMATDQPVVIYPLQEGGGRRVHIGGRFVGTAYGVLDLVAFVQEAGLREWDEMDVVRSGLIEWRGGGPEVWGG